MHSAHQNVGEQFCDWVNCKFILLEICNAEGRLFGRWGSKSGYLLALFHQSFQLTYKLLGLLLLPHQSQVQISSYLLCSQTPTVCTFPSVCENMFHTHTKCQAKLLFGRADGRTRFWTERQHELCYRPTLNLCMSGILIDYCNFHIFELYHIFPGLVSYLYVVILSCILLKHGCITYCSQHVFLFQLPCLLCFVVFMTPLKLILPAQNMRICIIFVHPFWCSSTFLVAESNSSLNSGGSRPGNVYSCNQA